MDPNDQLKENKEDEGIKALTPSPTYQVAWGDAYNYRVGQSGNVVDNNENGEGPSTNNNSNNNNDNNNNIVKKEEAENNLALLQNGDWISYPRNLKGFVPVIDHLASNETFFTYKSLFSETTAVDVFDLHDGIPSYRAQLNDDGLMGLFKSTPDLRVIFIDRISPPMGFLASSGRYTTTREMMQQMFTLHQVPMDFIRGHAVEREMTWPIETRCLVKEDGGLDTNSFEFWYNTKLRTKVLRGKGGMSVKQMAIYHRRDQKPVSGRECSVVYCVGADDVIKERFRQLRFPWSSFDEFSVHLVFLSRVLDCYTEESWNVREIVKILTFNQNPQMLLSNPDLSRDMHQKAEAATILEHELELLTEVVQQVQKHHNRFPKNDPYVSHRVDERLSSMISSTRQLRLWCQKCHIMMSGQLALAYNSISQADSRANIQIAMLAQKNSRRTAILSYITILFLPPTAVATIFGTNFFNYGPDGFQSSGKIWIFFVTTTVVTVIVCIVWALYKSWENAHLDDNNDQIWEGYNNGSTRGAPEPGGGGVGGNNGYSTGQDAHSDEESLRRYKEAMVGMRPLTRNFTARDLVGGGI